MYPHERTDYLDERKSQIPAHIAMLIVQLLAALYYVISRMALVSGMNRIVLCFYRDIVAMLILIPAAYFIDRGRRIKFSPNVVLRLILLGLFGVFGSNYLLLVGIEFTSAEFASALQPVGPALVALIAILFGVTFLWVVTTAAMKKGRRLAAPKGSVDVCMLSVSMVIRYLGHKYSLSAAVAANLAHKADLPVAFMFILHSSNFAFGEAVSWVYLDNRFDDLYWHRRDGQAKALGIVVSCAGGVLMTFYKGPAVLPWNQVGKAIPWYPMHDSFPNLLIPGTLRTTIHDIGITEWQFGAICLIGNTLCLALYLNLQGPLLRMFPAPVSVTAYSYGIGSIFMGLTGAYAIKDPSAWTLSWNMNLAAVIYTGVLGSALNFSLISWCLGRVGPLFVACYLPVQPVVSALLAFIIVGTTVYLGSVIGTVLILIGLLLVSWAHEERKRLALLSRLIFQRRYSDYFGESAREPFIGVRPRG